MNALSKPLTFSPQQQAVIEWTRNGKGSAFVEAVAGSGKTTTLIELLKQTKGSVAFAAYNKKIAEEIESKIADQIKKGLASPDLAKRVRVGTFHSFGFSAWRYVHKGVKAGPDAVRQKAALTSEFLRSQNVPEGPDSFIVKLVSLAKQRALGLFGSVENKSEWFDIIEHFDLAYEIEDEKMIDAGITAAIAVLRKHIEWAPQLIDFDDMIYMPVISGSRIWENDWVLIDEAQDTNPARRALARKMLSLRGRAVFVGDRYQSIYGFSGADSDAIDQIIRDFKCSLLPLTVTYRCPKTVVEEARKFVNHIEAHSSAPEGVVRTMEAADIAKQSLTASDAILCRNTKPLVTMAYELIRKGVACHVEGKDIGVGMITLVNRFSATSVNVLIAKLDAFGEREAQKLIAKGRETQAEALLDKIETVKVIAEGCQTRAQVVSKIAAMFMDGKDEARPTLTLSTVHRSKGREWARVFVLGFDTLMPSRFARQEWQMEQESNLQYVAYTRAMKELVLVSL